MVPAVVVRVKARPRVAVRAPVDAVASEVDVRGCVALRVSKPEASVEEADPAARLAEVEVGVAHDPRATVVDIVVGVRVLRWLLAGESRLDVEDVVTLGKLRHRFQRHVDKHAVDDPEVSRGWHLSSRSSRDSSS